MGQAACTIDVKTAQYGSNNNRGLIVASLSPSLNQISNIHGHLFNGGTVMFFNVLENSGIVLSHEVNGNTLSTEATTSTDPVNVVFPVGWQIIVDDERHLLNVNTTGQQVSCDKDTGGTRTELSHDHVSLLLVHVTVHGRHCEVTLVHLLSQPVDLPPGVAEDDSLGNGEGLVEVAQGVKLPLLTLDRDVELANTLEGELLLLNEDADRVPHEPGGHLKHLLGHCSGQKDHLNLLVEMTEDIVDLVLETTRQHLVSLVEHKLLDIVGPEPLPADHVEDTAGGAHHNVLTNVQLPHVFPD